jgi:SAM-dependent methyltransferase
VSDPQGLAFDALAEDYDLGRTGWPMAMLDGLDGESVLDLAAGTGKLTSLLVRRYPDVVAVEPLAGMRAILERNAHEATVLAGHAEHIPIDDCSVDAVFVAEAFHWFDSKLAVREIARVLRPGGTLLVCFMEWLGDFDPPLPTVVRETLATVWAGLPAPGGPKVQSGAWKAGFATAPFGPLAERTHPYTWTTGRDGIAAYFVSTSSMGALPADERTALRERLVELVPDVEYTLATQARVFRTVRS